MGLPLPRRSGRRRLATSLALVLATAACPRSPTLADAEDVLDDETGQDDTGSPPDVFVDTVPADTGRDAGAPDVGPPDTGRADTGAPVDAPPDLAMDTGVARDVTVDTGGPDSGVDAFEVRPDVGPPTGGDTCADAIDTDLGGRFHGDTCSADDTTTATCNPAGTPDRIYFIHGVDRLAAYNFHLPAGFVFYFVSTAGGGCAASSTSCLGSSSIGARSPVFFAVERTGGGCGEYDLEVVPPP